MWSFIIFHYIPAEDEPKTLEQVAKSCANEDGTNSPSSSPDKQQLSLAEAAKVYEDTANPSKSKLEQVEVVTGEEEEKNVLKVQICTLLPYMVLHCSHENQDTEYSLVD